MRIFRDTSLNSKRPVSWCTVSGGNPEREVKVKALWDSGADGTFLSRKIAEAMNLPILDVMTANVATGEAIKGYHSQVDLKFGDNLSFQRHTVVVIDMNREDEEVLVIGMDLLIRGLFHLEPGHNTLKITFVTP